MFADRSEGVGNVTAFFLPRITPSAFLALANMQNSVFLVKEGLL